MKAPTQINTIKQPQNEQLATLTQKGGNSVTQF